MQDLGWLGSSPSRLGGFLVQGKAKVGPTWRPANAIVSPGLVASSPSPPLEHASRILQLLHLETFKPVGRLCDQTAYCVTGSSAGYTIHSVQFQEAPGTSCHTPYFCCLCNAPNTICASEGKHCTSTHCPAFKTTKLVMSGRLRGLEDSKH